jgi:hypothetical protein
LAWVELLTYTKTDGQAGAVKAIAPAVFGRTFGINVADVNAMLAAAQAGEDPALMVDDGTWIIVKWPDYQETDPTAAERQRRFRADRSRLSPLRRDNRDTPLQPVTNGVTRHATLTVTYDKDSDGKKEKEKENPPSGGTKKTRGAQLRDDWRPTEQHRELANRLKLDIALEYDRFRDHAASVGRVCRDWDAAFRNWLRKAAEFTRKGTISNGSEASRIRTETPGKGRHNGSSDPSRIVVDRMVSESGTHYWDATNERWMPL